METACAIGDEYVRAKTQHTNKLAWVIVLTMVACVFLGFILAIYSIHEKYIGALQCYTVTVTPLATVLGIVLNSTVKKSEAENTGSDGTGINYAKFISTLQSEEVQI